ncbi:MAG: DUF535 family protein [Parvularculaceae bacterium]
MSMTDFGFMLARTAPVFNYSPRDLKGRATMIARALKSPEAVAAIREAPGDSTLARTLEDRPQMIGAFSWPFMCAAWEPEERWARIVNHCAAVDQMAPVYRMRVPECAAIADFSDIEPGLSIVLDRPKWFMREGLLTLNMFLGDFRAFSLSFSFFTEADASLTAYVGAIQGRNRDNILDAYRRLTKSFFGLRPRDFLFETFRALCRHAGAARILAVSDASRHHRHPYFKAEKVDYTTNYDEAWADRGGVRTADTHWEIDISPARKDLSEVKPNKRSMYRKRFEFLDALDQRITDGLEKAQPVAATADGDL